MAEHRLGKGYFTCIKVAEVNRFVFLLTVCFVGFNKTTSSSFFFFFLLSFFFPPFRSSCGYAVSRLISLSLFALIGFMEANSALRETCKKQPCVLATLFFFFFEQHKAEYRRGSCLLCHGLRRKPSVTTVIEPSAFFSFLFFFFYLPVWRCQWRQEPSSSCTLHAAQPKLREVCFCYSFLLRCY